jgi:hypothetical protein
MTLMPDVSGRATLCAVLTEWRRLLDASVSVPPKCQSSVRYFGPVVFQYC